MTEESCPQPLSVSSIFANIQRYSHSFLNQKLGEGDLGGSQLFLLGMVSAHEGLNQEQMAKELLSSKAAIAKSLSRLAESGHIRKERDKKDNRAHRIFLTDAGREAVSSSKDAFMELETLLFGDLSYDEYCQLEELLKKIYFGILSKR